jgi:tetratricopeptide (TPR) repeat protein
VWQGLHEEFQAHDVDVVAIGIDVDPETCYPYVDKAPELAAAGLSLIDSAHSTVGALNFRNVPMAIWVDADGTIVLPAHQSPVTPGWGDREIPEGIPPRIAGRIELLKAAKDRHQEYLGALRHWVQTSEAPKALETELTQAQSQAVAAFELGDHFRKSGKVDEQIACWRAAHELDPNNWAAKRQAWTLVTTPEGAAPDLMQEDTGPYEGNWLDDVVAVGGIKNYYPPSPW